jgi:hypothetical protein
MAASELLNRAATACQQDAASRPVRTTRPGMPCQKCPWQSQTATIKKAPEALLPRIKKVYVRKEKRAVLILLEHATIHIDMRILREYSQNKSRVLCDCCQQWVLSPCFGFL